MRDSRSLNKEDRYSGQKTVGRRYRGHDVCTRCPPQARLANRLAGVHHRGPHRRPRLPADRCETVVRPAATPPSRARRHERGGRHTMVDHARRHEHGGRQGVRPPGRASSSPAGASVRQGVRPTGRPVAQPADHCQPACARGRTTSSSPPPFLPIPLRRAAAAGRLGSPRSSSGSSLPPPLPSPIGERLVAALWARRGRSAQWDTGAVKKHRR